MSLLLDALKKAAEQKAEKEEGPGAEGAAPADTPAHDETQTATALVTDLSVDPDEIDSAATVQVHSNSINIDSEEVTDLGEETIMGNFDEDQTMVLADDDVTSFFGDRDSPVNGTEAAMPDEDLSLYLLDEEGQAELLPDGPETGSLAASTEVQLLADSRATTSNLNLRGTPKPDDLDDADRTVIVRADETLTEGDIEGLTNTQGLGYKEQTSTRTYAPDNYDRTLIKMPDDDASDLFAGMKSDSDDVMTPAYAKKVFVSKSFAQRRYNFRIYGGLGFGILLFCA